MWSKALKAGRVGTLIPDFWRTLAKAGGDQETSEKNGACNDKRAAVVGDGETATREEQSFEG